MRTILAVALSITAFRALAAEIPTYLPKKNLAATASSRWSAVLPISRPILRDSARIFSGTVLQVEHRNSGSSSGLATTRIRFRVDEAIRNVRRGQVIEVNEWGGLWQSGERYRPGERVLLFLYRPSKLGLTSPVGSHAGRFPVDRAGRVLLPNPRGRASQPVEIRRLVAAIRQVEGE